MSRNPALPEGTSFNLPVATEDEWTSELQETISPGRDALVELQSLYMLFGHTSDAIPLVNLV